jgi:hypothetical protein
MDLQSEKRLSFVNSFNCTLNYEDSFLFSHFRLNGVFKFVVNSACEPQRKRCVLRNLKDFLGIFLTKNVA